MGVIDLIFPKKCLGCKKEGVYLCPSCLGNLRRPFPVCPECLRFSRGGKTHKICKEEGSLDGLISLWIYERVIRKAILALKYKFGYEITKEMGKEVAKELKKKSFQKKPLLIPIPLHWQRQNWRGFNQAEEIARVLARQMGWEFIPDLLKRKIRSAPQTELARKERIENIKGVFVMGRRMNNKRKKIYIFDDVWTTGSTIKEAAKTLKEFGYKEVWGLTLAKGR